MALFSVFTFNSSPALEHTLVERYATAIGGQQDVTLPDGSLISLNTDTALTVDFSGEDRLVTLERGEAFFDIAKDKRRYFKVHAGSQTVTVLGTKFNIQKRGQEYTVAVVEGLVAVHPKGRLLDSPVQEATLAIGSKQHATLELTGQFRLKAGNVITYKDETQLVSASNLASTNKYREWQTGIVTFDAETLSVLVAELSRYTNKKVLIVDKDLETLEISGVFHLRKLDEVILGLEAAFPLHILNQKDAILISGS
ncbi:MAG: FecR domain-containing protein [Kordiimonadaceae bacterium]|nr:FecR domain-containing protein [Kordiimonadaceae bacterium]